MISVKVDASGPHQALSALGVNLDDMREPLTAALELCLKDAQDEIRAQGGLFGGGWAPMSPWTGIVSEVLYAKTRDPGGLLMDSGGLMASLEGGNLEVGRKGGEAVVEAVSPRTGFGIARGMQEGTSRTFLVLQGFGFAETGIPPRPFLGWHDSRLEDYTAVFSEHVWKDVDVALEA